MLSGVTGQSQISTSAASYPGSFEWATTGGTEMKSPSLRDFTETVIDQDTAVYPTAMASQYAKASDANNMVPLYPSLSASLFQGAPSQIPEQGHSLSLPHQEGSRVYYYNQGTLGPLLSGELGPYLQPYGSVPHTESRAPAPQPQVLMVLKEIQPTNVIPPASTSGIYYRVCAQPITETSVQGEYNQQGGGGGRSAFKHRVHLYLESGESKQEEFMPCVFDNYKPKLVLFNFRPSMTTANGGGKVGHCNSHACSFYEDPKSVPRDATLFTALSG